MRRYITGYIPVIIDYFVQEENMDNLHREQLIREKIRAQYSPAEIMELEGFGDHCRLRLRDGSLFLANLNNDNSLRLTEIDEVC